MAAENYHKFSNTQRSVGSSQEKFIIFSQIVPAAKIEGKQQDDTKTCDAIDPRWLGISR